jgi:hypothetical protein
MMDRSWLVADLGGTNARFAIAESDNRKVTHEIPDRRQSCSQGGAAPVFHLTKLSPLRLARSFRASFRLPSVVNWPV